MNTMVKAKLHLKNLIRTGERRVSRKGFLRLDMNESPSGLSDRFFRKCIAGINPQGIAMYPEYGNLRQMIARHNHLSAQNFCLANGSDAAIKYIFDAYIELGDRILITDPTFAMYPVYAQMFQAEAVPIPYNADFSFPLPEFLDAISRKIKIAVVVNPNNPTGSILAEDDLLRILKKTADAGVLLIVDEAYFYFYPKTVIAKVKEFPNLVVLRTFSKLCGIASLRLGYAAAAPGIIKNLLKVKPTYDVNGFAVLMAERLLSEPSVIKKLIDETMEGKNYLAGCLSRAGIEYRNSYANFLLIKCGVRSKEITQALAQRNILVHSGFKQHFLKDYIRVTVGDINVMKRFAGEFLDIVGKS